MKDVLQLAKRWQSMKRYFCTTCKFKSTDSAEELAQKMQPRICIGHVGLAITGIIIVAIELLA